MSEPGFTVWVTGPEPRDVDDVVSLLGGKPHGTTADGRDGRRAHARHLWLGAEAAGAAVVLAAGLLTRHGVVTVVALPGTREVRDRARRGPAA
jgi:hypothetical protein